MRGTLERDNSLSPCSMISHEVRSLIAIPQLIVNFCLKLLFISHFKTPHIRVNNILLTAPHDYFERKSCHILTHMNNTFSFGSSISCCNVSPSHVHNLHKQEQKRA